MDSNYVMNFNGLLEFDDDELLEEIVSAARTQYIAQFHVKPDTAHVPLDLLPEGETEVVLDGVRVIGLDVALPGHIWMFKWRD